MSGIDSSDQKMTLYKIAIRRGAILILYLTVDMHF